MYISFDSICDEVEKIKTKHYESDPFRLCKAMGIKVIYTPMGEGSEACKGFYLIHNRIKTITINSNLSSELGRIICSHELGHAVLHKDKAGVKAFHDFGLFDSVSSYEYEANVFAAELLLEDEDVLDSLNDDMSFFQAAANLNVPAEILDFKFRILKQKRYKVTDAPFISPGNWLKNAMDEGTPDDYGI